jgi:hypothetical protein
MRSHRFEKKLKLPATVAIKHQLRALMYLDALAKAEMAEHALNQSADSRAKGLLVPPSQVVRFRSSSALAARSDTNFGIQGPLSNSMILVPLLNPKFAIAFAARCARTSGSGH